MVLFQFSWIRIRLLLLPLLMAYGQLSAVEAVRTDQSEFQNPELLGRVNLLVPWDIQHISDNWTTGYVRLRIGPDGLVKDWIPLDLPHYKLIPAIDRALADARFSPGIKDGEAFTVDISAKIPLDKATSYRVISETLAEHIESMQARMNPQQFQVVVSSRNELDDPLLLISGTEGYQVVNEDGARLSGKVLLSFFVDTKGRPRMIRVEETSRPDLISAAIMTAQELRFTPPTRNRQPTVVSARIPVIFGEQD